MITTNMYYLKNSIPKMTYLFLYLYLYPCYFVAFFKISLCTLYEPAVLFCILDHNFKPVLDETESIIPFALLLVL